MTKKKARPEFTLPSTEPKAGAAPSSEWVYKSDDGDDTVAEPEPDLSGDTVTNLWRGKQTVATYSRIAAVSGLIPIPAVDVIAVGGVQLKMVAALAQIYGVPFNRNLGKSVIAAVIGSLGSAKLGYGYGRSMLKAIPVIGSVGGMIAMPAFAFTLTWAIGRVFVRHFESGGTLADADAIKMREQFETELAAAR